MKVFFPDFSYPTSQTLGFLASTALTRGRCYAELYIDEPVAGRQTNCFTLISVAWIFDFSFGSNRRWVRSEQFARFLLIGHMCLHGGSGL